MPSITKSIQLLLLSIMGWSLIWIGTTIMGLMWNDYSIITHTVSVLGSAAAPAHLLMNIIFVIDGTLLIISSFKLNRLLDKEITEIGSPHFIALAGVLLVLLAFFPGGEVIGLQVPTQTAHNLIAALLMISFIFASVFFLIEMKNYDEWKLTLKIVLILTILKVVLYTGSGLAIVLTGAITHFAGLFQKLGLTMEGFWLITISYKFVQLDSIHYNWPLLKKLKDLVF